MVKLERGIAIWIKPKGKEVIAIGDGKGQMAWIKTEDIVDTHPKNYEKLQTIILKLVDNAMVKWVPEKDYDQYKAKYNTIKPLPEPIPTDFGGSQTTTKLPPPPKGGPPGTPSFTTPTTSAPQTTKGYFELIISELAAVRRDIDLMKRAIDTIWDLLEATIQLPPQNPISMPNKSPQPKEDLGLDDTL